MIQNIRVIIHPDKIGHLDLRVKHPVRKAKADNDGRQDHDAADDTADDRQRAVGHIILVVLLLLLRGTRARLLRTRLLALRRPLRLLLTTLRRTRLLTLLRVRALRITRGAVAEVIVDSLLVVDKIPYPHRSGCRRHDECSREYDRHRY